MTSEPMDFNDVHKSQGADAVRQQIYAAQPPNLDPWPEPDMRLIQNFRPPAPEFPLDVFGKAIATWIEDAAASKSAPKDYTISGLLASASVLIGNARHASPWSGWVEPPVAFLCSVGLPSSGKTPGIGASTDLLRDFEQGINPGFDDQVNEYKTRMAQAEATKKEWDTAVKAAIKNDRLPPPFPAEAEEPEEPSKKRLCVMDATVEVLAPLLKNNVKGIMLYRDELAGWLAGLNQYKGSGGSDRPFYLEAYNGKRYVVDRVKFGPGRFIEIPYLSIPIVGGIQPERLNSALLSDADDGMAARFLYFFPDSIAPVRPYKSPDNSLIKRAFEKLHRLSLQLNEQGQMVPVVIPLEPQAADALDVFRRSVHEAEKTASGHYLSYLGKNPGKVIRLALILEYLEWAVGSIFPEPTHVSEGSIKAAIRLVIEYFDPMAARVFEDAALPEPIRNAVKIAKKIIGQKQRPTIINARDIQRARIEGIKTSEIRDAALDELVEAGWLIPLAVQTGGRPRVDYRVNPKIWERK